MREHIFDPDLCVGCETCRRPPIHCGVCNYERHFCDLCGSEIFGDGALREDGCSLDLCAECVKKFDMIYEDEEDDEDDDV